MSRVVNSGDTPAKRRNAHLRSCAEVVRLLAQREALHDEEARDMVAFLVVNLRGIWTTISESADVWDVKDYPRKAETLRQSWKWSRQIADELEAHLRAKAWEQLPMTLMAMAGQLQDIDVSTITRNADWWGGAYRSLIRSTPAPDARR